MGDFWLISPQDFTLQFWGEKRTIFSQEMSAFEKTIVNQ
jgi:hypothetical protein